MKSYNLIGGGILILIASAVVTEVESFIVHQHQTCAIMTRTRPSLQRTTSTKPLFLLHIDELHPHRDSVTRLDDPIPEVAEKKHISNDKKLHIFTHHIAPIVLATYLVGHYLSTYHNTLLETGGNMSVDSHMAGYVLIVAGVMMMKYSIDNAFLSPV